MYFFIDNNIEYQFDTISKCIDKAHKVMTSIRRRSNDSKEYCGFHQFQEIRIYREVSKNELQWVGKLTNKNTEVYYDPTVFAEVKRETSWKTKTTPKTKKLSKPRQ